MRREVLEAREKALGYEHSDTIASVRKLESLLRDREKGAMDVGLTNDYCGGGKIG